MVENRYSATEFPRPSRRRLLLMSLAALAVAALLLVTVILPAELGLDPTGLGRLTGLTELASARAPASVPTSSPQERPVVQYNEFGEAIADRPAPGMNGRHAEPYRSDSVEIALAPGEGLEYKVELPAGEPLLYAWSTDGDAIYYDLHAEPAAGEGFPADYFLRYREDQDGAAAANGYLVAPFRGHHGWYLLNYNEAPVRVRLRISGNYSWHGLLAE